MPADLWGKYPGAPVYVCTGPKAATSWKHRLDDDTVPLAGREEEVKLLSKYLEETGLEKINSGPVVHLLGDPGTGKSKLLQAFLANVKQRNRNLTVIELAGSSYGGRPGRLLLEFMDEWANEGLRPTGAKDSDRRIPGSPAAKIRLVARWFAELKKHTPALIVIDDVHWADRESVKVLGKLFASLPANMMLIISYRPSGSGRKQ